MDALKGSARFFIIPLTFASQTDRRSINSDEISLLLRVVHHCQVSSVSVQLKVWRLTTPLCERTDLCLFGCPVTLQNPPPCVQRWQLGTWVLRNCGGGGGGTWGNNGAKWLLITLVTNNKIKVVRGKRPGFDWCPAVKKNTPKVLLPGDLQWSVRRSSFQMFWKCDLALTQ